MIQETRIQPLNAAPSQSGQFVLYWMQASQRAEFNHALEYAIRRADELKVPVIACFGLYDDYPESNARHMAFMLQGLQETQKALQDRGIQLVVRKSRPDQAALEFARKACELICDRGYLRHQKKWRQNVAKQAKCPVVQVETDVTIPVEVTSSKEEYAARTIRPKIHDQLLSYLVPVEQLVPQRDSLDIGFNSADVGDWKEALSRLTIDRSITLSKSFTGGASKAKQLLREFITNRLDEYDNLRNEPSLDWVSHMSPYLHFGQISPAYIALEVLDANVHGADVYLEELIVRRELAINFVHYNSQYDSIKALPEWAQKTLMIHSEDQRPYLYSGEQLENAETHDPYWNAAQREMMETGKMHNYMRMYWGKKIIEWNDNPAQAHALMAHLNNKYELDGRDPVSWSNFLWCFGKHDQAWKEREIFGKVRWMSAAGLERKFDMDAYVDRVSQLADV